MRDTNTDKLDRVRALVKSWYSMGGESAAYARELDLALSTPGQVARDQRNAEMLAMHDKGLAVEAIAQRFKVTQYTVRSAIREAQFQKRFANWTPDDDDFGWVSVRCENTLRRNGLSLSSACGMTDESLLSIPELGRVTLAEIRAFCARRDAVRGSNA